MAKVRFYADVPEYADKGYSLFASTKLCGRPVDGWKRVAFDVEMPPDVYKSFDVPAIAGPAREVPVDDGGDHD